MELPPKENRKVELNITAKQLPSQAMMISAVADSCSVRLDKVNRKVYKFRALVFSTGKLYCFSVFRRAKRIKFRQ